MLITRILLTVAIPLFCFAALCGATMLVTIGERAPWRKGVVMVVGAMMVSAVVMAISGIAFVWGL